MTKRHCIGDLWVRIDIGAYYTLERIAVDELRNNDLVFVLRRAAGYDFVSTYHAKERVKVYAHDLELYFERGPVID